MKKEFYVQIVDKNGRQKSPSGAYDKARKGDVVAALVIDGNGRLLRALYWDGGKLAQYIRKRRAKGTSDVMIAAGLAGIGSAADLAVFEEISAALKRLCR